MAKRIKRSKFVFTTKENRKPMPKKPMNGHNAIISKNRQDVAEYTRKSGKVKAHFKGMGPNKTIPNIPQERLMPWLTAHGVIQDNIKRVYLYLLKHEATTHDLINMGLLDQTDYINALNGE